MVKLSNQNGSIRTLNSKHLVVDWFGYHKLFYRMTRGQVNSALKIGKAETEERHRDEAPQLKAFDLFLHPSGGMEIGCERFTREDVRKIKRWAKEGK